MMTSYQGDLSFASRSLGCAAIRPRFCNGDMLEYRCRSLFEGQATDGVCHRCGRLRGEVRKGPALCALGARDQNAIPVTGKEPRQELW